MGIAAAISKGWGSVWYHARKFLRRYWMPVSAAALVIASLSIGLYIANRERALAQRRFEEVDKLVFYARNPRKNDAAVDRMCSSIREFGFKIPVLARSDGEVVDGHLRLKAARKLGIAEVPVLLCDEWTPQQVKAWLMVNRSVTWADWDEELLSLELQELNAADFDLSFTGFNPGEIDALLAIPDEERANEAQPLPENPVSRVGDLWICGKHRVLCADALRAEDVARLLGDRKPLLMVTDPPYGIGMCCKGG